MSKIAELWAKEMEEEIAGIERLIHAAAERAADLQSDPLLNGQKQSVAALKNHLMKLAEDAATLRKAFRPAAPEVEESVDADLVEHLKAERNGKTERNGKLERNGKPERNGTAVVN